MYLEDVNVEGFKSFSQKTEMSFQPGISVIIGNNGVGKSNILDAVVWAMGEDDIQKMRCHDSSELFFVGSKNSPPADRIRVELNFKQPAENSVPGVQVVRELIRNGDAFFYVNGESVHRKDYRKYLAEFNLDDALKTIIKQEQINDILMLDPVQRRSRIARLIGVENETELEARIADEIGPKFESYLQYLFPDGNGALESISRNGTKGLYIEVNLRNDRKRKAHQLSGGEKSVTSLALQLAVFGQLKSPLFLLDEVEPALDYTNHKSMQALLKHLAENRQLIMITHLRSTIQLANTVHGIRTRPDGSSFMKFYFVMDERLLRLYKCC
jgi:chromosome segregation protein